MRTRSKNSVRTSRRAGGGGGSTRSAGRAWSARSNPSATSGSRSAIRGETAYRRSGRRSCRGLDPGERRQQRLAVAHRAGHRAGMVERRGQRDDPPERDEPTRRFDRRRPALGRGDTQRACGVGAGRRGHLPRGERRAGAAAGAARRALERPRVADLVGRPAAGELVACAGGRAAPSLRRRAAPRRRSRAPEPRPAHGSTRSAASPRPRRGPSDRSGSRTAPARPRQRAARRPARQRRERPPRRPAPRR